MATMTRAELFRQSKINRKREVEEAAKSKEEFTDSTAYMALSLEYGKVVRLLGAPLSMRQKATDPKLILTSMLTTDTGGKFRCVWPDKADNPDWILWKIFNLVTAYKWNAVKEAKDYIHQDAHPEALHRVLKNNSDNQFENGWYPSKLVVWNGIDRQDYAWHVENKHSKILTKKASVGKNGSVWNDPGIPLGLYNIIYDDIVEFYDDWEAYDIVIQKLKQKPFYKAYHGIHEAIKISEKNQKLIVEGPLTEEERSWELYDLDEMYPITQYRKINAKLGEFVKFVDAEFNTQFEEELLELCAKEQEELDANAEADGPKAPVTKQAAKTTAKVVQPTMPVPPVTKPAVAPVVAPTTRPTRTSVAVPMGESKAPVIDWDKLSDGSFNGTAYLGVPVMTDEEKAMVVSIRADGTFEYVPTLDGEKVVLYGDGVSEFLTPGTFHVHPVTGELFEDEEEA